jgi:hypothetical protein
LVPLEALFKLVPLEGSARLVPLEKLAEALAELLTAALPKVVVESVPTAARPVC